MRRPKPEAAMATFEVLNERTQAALERGASISGVAHFPGNERLAPRSLLLEAAYGKVGPGGLIRVELLVNDGVDEQQYLSPGTSFELMAGKTLLGQGQILLGARTAENQQAPLDKSPSLIWQGDVETTLWAA